MRVLSFRSFSMISRVVLLFCENYLKIQPLECIGLYIIRSLERKRPIVIEYFRVIVLRSLRLQQILLRGTLYRA
jgi:hypothetical protein